MHLSALCHQCGKHFFHHSYRLRSKREKKLGCNPRRRKWNYREKYHAADKPLLLVTFIIVYKNKHRYCKHSPKSRLLLTSDVSCVLPVIFLAFHRPNRGDTAFLMTLTFAKLSIKLHDANRFHNFCE